MVEFKRLNVSAIAELLRKAGQLQEGTLDFVQSFGMVKSGGENWIGKYSREFINRQEDGTEVKVLSQSIGVSIGNEWAPIFAKIPAGTPRSCTTFEIRAYAMKKDYTPKSGGKTTVAGTIVFQAHGVVDEKSEE